LDVASPVDEDSGLPSDFPGDLRKKACKFRGTYLVERNPPPIDTLDSLDLIGLQPECVAEYLLYGLSPGKVGSNILISIMKILRQPIRKVKGLSSPTDFLRTRIFGII
jgi:hypothetical protein